VRSALVAAVLLLAGAPPVRAESWHDADAERDVTTYTHAAEPPPCGTDTHGTDPTDARRDITRLAVAHDRDMVTIRISMGEVSRRDADTGWILHLEVPGHSYMVFVNRLKHGKPLMAGLAKQPHYPDSSQGDGCGSYVFMTAGISCDGLAATSDPRRDRVEVSIPRGCVKKPRWLRVGVDSFGGFGGDTQNYSTHGDYWAPPGIVRNGFLPPYGPKVFRS
jgi:hypothetical protein